MYCSFVMLVKALTLTNGTFLVKGYKIQASKSMRWSEAQNTTNENVKSAFLCINSSTPDSNSLKEKQKG